MDFQWRGLGTPWSTQVKETPFANSSISLPRFHKLMDNSLLRLLGAPSGPCLILCRHFVEKFTQSPIWTQACPSPWTCSKTCFSTQCGGEKSAGKARVSLGAWAAQASGRGPGRLGHAAASLIAQVLPASRFHLLSPSVHGDVT